MNSMWHSTFEGVVVRTREPDFRRRPRGAGDWANSSRKAASSLLVMRMGGMCD
jgi:hypothetical protein